MAARIDIRLKYSPIKGSALSVWRRLLPRTLLSNTVMIPLSAERLFTFGIEIARLFGSEGRLFLFRETKEPNVYNKNLIRYLNFNLFRP